MLQKDGATFQYSFAGRVVPSWTRRGVEHWLMITVYQQDAKTESIVYDPVEAVMEVDGRPVKPLLQHWYSTGNGATELASSEPIAARGQVQVIMGFPFVLSVNKKYKFIPGSVTISGQRFILPSVESVFVPSYTMSPFQH